MLSRTSNGFYPAQVVVPVQLFEKEVYCHMQSDRDNGKKKVPLVPSTSTIESKVNVVGELLPSAFTHISTGVVNASPGVVKIPPCVLR